MRTWASVVGVAFLALLAAGCGDEESPKSPDEKGKGTGAPMIFSGVVKKDSGMGSFDPLADVEVRATVDRNKDGVISADEAVVAQTDGEGAFALEIKVAEGDKVLLRFSKAGMASVFRNVRAAPDGNMTLTVTMKPLEPLDCAGVDCRGKGVVLNALPEGSGGNARVFNPVTETDQFPGDFSDSDGNLLISGVFGRFELTDANGDPLEKLDSPATLKMKVPRDTWSVMKDIKPGSDRIEVPFYAFDEIKGTWVREDDGFLEDGEGAVIPESALASIRDGTFDGVIFAVSDVKHFSSWNLDWPVESYGRIGGEVGECWWNGERKPCAGSTVTARGESYAGNSPPYTVGPDGRFSINVMRSEAPGEDLDGDGITGESTTISVRVLWDGRVYDIGNVTMPPTPVPEGGGDTKDLGILRLDDSNLLEAGLCSFTGNVHTVDGAPAAGAMVYAADEELSSDEYMSLCFGAGQLNCDSIVLADAAGAFSFRTATMARLVVMGVMTREIDGGSGVEYAFGTRTFRSCPTAPVQLTLDEGWVALYAEAFWDEGEISWTPAEYGAASIWVISADTVKWVIESEAGKIMSPVSYGVVPEGATQAWPVDASPEAIASGDTITVILAGTTAKGFDYFGSGSVVVP